MNAALAAMIKRLPKAQDWSDAFELIGRLVADRQYKDLLEAGVALEAEAGAGQAIHVFESAFNRMESDLALSPAPGAAEAVIQLLRVARRKSRQRERTEAWRQRHVASYLGAGQSAETLGDCLAKHGGDVGFEELFACWIQESLLRGRPVAATPSAIAFWDRLVRTGHPLAVLPLDLVKMESELPDYLPRYSKGGAAWGIPEVETESRMTGGSVNVPAMRMVEVPLGIDAAVRGWEQESNGVVESCAAAAGEPLALGVSVAAILTACGLSCVRGTTPADVPVMKGNAGNCLAVLFGAASNGGAYGGGVGPAYGRLHAWQSLGGLAGAEASRVDETAALADACTWFTFSSPWFNDIAWDVGIACIRPDRRSVAVLAATDQD